MGRTGGASVIGSGTAHLFLDEGVVVILTDHNNLPQQFGCIDAVVNRAAMALLKDIEATTLDDWQATIDPKPAVIH